MGIFDFFNIRKPIVGEMWIYYQSIGDPWLSNEDNVKIIGVKDDWVRYEFGSGGNHKKPMDEFVRIYTYNYTP